LTGNHSNAGGGVSVYFFSRPVIRDCWIAYNSGGGVWIETDNGLAGPPAARIENTEIIRNAGYGVSVIKGAKVDIVRTTIAYNNGDGVRSEQANARVAINHCIITNNQGGGIVRRDTQACFVLSCNNVYGNLMGSWLGPQDSCFSGRGPGSVSIDPLFNNPLLDDFGLMQNSPLFDLCEQGACGALGANIECPTGVSWKSWSSVKSLYRGQ
jgi:hypothetical protein